ncbi:ABC-2 type transporter-domain-containing protein [Schizophyllum amplum]|uniref:ABC-2 type transporter-domain-containing protein n=1 Tax=Schizophyllum amplum TaxID=97359 RepID=A0A550C9U3_9AGAR|nr:ABC-2 type transporter-domain-containing protein [Auriculariopsis ampla]
MSESPPGQYDHFYGYDHAYPPLRPDSFIEVPEDHHVDVVEAEKNFNELARSLSRQSRSQRNVRNATNDNAAPAPMRKADPEMGKADDDEPFDLHEYLASSNDAQQAAGIKHKHVGVTWENLQVDVMGGVNSKVYIPTLLDAIVGFVLSPLFIIWGFIKPMFPTAKLPSRTILHKSSGVLKPGEMCLVLGAPGSGCSTFLKVIANERGEYANVQGDVRYAGIEAHEMAKHYKGEVVYNEEDDVHIPTLTVGQTLEFALSTKTPGPSGRLPGVSRKQFNSEVEDMLLKMLNISHTKNTLVGNEFVRGVSGGERKRVSIAEMMTTRARVQTYDNSTRGLDASTALDFAKSLRIMTDVLGQTVFVSLYQAGEGIYELFDKVMVLDKGRQVFYGPPSEARLYFEDLGFKSLPRQTSPDYLTGCTDPHERQFAPGRSADNVPSTPEDLERAFQMSKFAQEVTREREEYNEYMKSERTDQEAFRAAVLADKKKGVSKKSPYTLGYFGQVAALTKRQFFLRKQDAFQLVTSFALFIILGAIVGGAYFGQPLTAAGAFTRTSVVFASLFNICLDAFGEIPAAMMGRPITRRQTSYSMYRPSALALANTIADFPFSASRLFLFNLLVYFMSNLDRSAGGFFTYYVVNLAAYLSFQSCFRMMALVFKSFDHAFRLAVIVLPIMLEYCGYFIPVDTMPRWLFWIQYIHPFSYAWSALMGNEFMRIDLACDGEYVVPRNGNGVDKYPDVLGSNQACTLYGSTGGEQTVPGEDYIQSGYFLSSSDLWRRNFVVLIGFMVLFIAAQVVIMDYFPSFGAGSAVAIFAKPGSEEKKLNSELQRKKQLTHSKNDSVDSLADAKRPYRKTFTWENVNYTVPVPGGTRRILHDICGFVKPGTLTALMGSSGAGKTTCLDVLAQRKNVGVITGDILVDGRPLAHDFARKTAYAEQMDALRFSAYLRQPSHVPIDEKNEYVEEIIDLLELQDLTEALVLSLSVEARKRLTIGVELASKPELLLFLDEPTSGLDAQSAWNLVRFLRKLADQGQAILCTIHQPSSLLFESFDRLLLLERGGETVYFGDIGSDSHILRDYFARYGAVCPQNVNPAEYMLEAIGAGIAPRVGDRDWKDVWLDSPEYRAVRQEIDEIKARGLSRPDDTDQKASSYATSFFYQLSIVLKRNNLAIWRSADYILSRLFTCIAISLMITIGFINLGNSVRDMQYRVFSIYWVIIIPAFVMSQIEPLFIFNRRTFVRESSARIYSPYVFAIGQLLSEIPYSFACGIVYWVLMVYPQKFGQGSAGLDGTGFQLLVVMFMMLFGVSLGQFIASISPNIGVAVLFNPWLNLVMGTFCGVTIPYPAMISFWKVWLYELNPFTRTIAAMVSTELHGLNVTCEAEEFSVFSPPSGQSCLEWAGDFVKASGGYLDNPDATDSCRYCQYRVGDEYFEPLHMSYEKRWRDAFILLAFFGFNAIMTISKSFLLSHRERYSDLPSVASRYLRFAKR